MTFSTFSELSDGFERERISAAKPLDTVVDALIAMRRHWDDLPPELRDEIMPAVRELAGMIDYLRRPQ